MTKNNETPASTLSEKVVVFLDILGFKELVKEAAKDEDKALALDGALAKIENIKILGKIMRANINVTIFSDSVVISGELQKTTLTQLIDRLAEIIWELMTDGIWMRGGVAIGLLSNTPHRPWGPAFIKAYETEAYLAVHPRVVFSKTTYEWFAEGIDMAALSELQKFHIKRDKRDGIYYIDIIARNLYKAQYESSKGKKYHKKYNEDLSKIRDHLNHGHAQAMDNPRVFEKYVWLCREWDRTLGRMQKDTELSFEPYYTDARQESAGDFDIATLPKA